MKVAIYAGMFKKNHDGSVKTLYELINSLLQKKDTEVGVWGFSITPQLRKGLKLFNIASIPLPLYPDYRITLPNPKLKKQIKNFSPDVIHITVPDFVGISIMKFARKEGIPVLTSFHTDFPSYLKSYRLGLFYKPAWKYLKWFYNKSCITLAPTEEIIRKLKNKGINHTKLWSRGIHRNRYSNSYRSQSLRTIWCAQNKKVILYCGRFVWYKDLDMFIEVYQHFNDLGPKDVVFVLAGDGPIREELERKMPKAIFPGYLVGESLSRVYASADIFLFPSTTETFGNVVLEALASGLPAVVSDIGGCKEIVQSSGSGLVAKAGDSMDFYLKCKQLVEDKTLYKALQVKASIFVKSRNWSNINNRVINEYQEIIIRNNKKKIKSDSGILIGDY